MKITRRVEITMETSETTIIRFGRGFLSEPYGGDGQQPVEEEAIAFPERDGTHGSQVETNCTALNNGIRSSRKTAAR